MSVRYHGQSKLNIKVNQINQNSKHNLKSVFEIMFHEMVLKLKSKKCYQKEKI